MSETVKERVERELAALKKIGRNPVVAPYLLADAEHVARYFAERYRPAKEGVRDLPGLVEMKLPATVGEDILYLVDGIKAINLVLYREPSMFPLTRVREIIAELQVFLRWEAESEPELEVQLDNMRTAHGHARRVDDWMVSLGEHAMLGRTHEERLKAIPAFPASLLDEAEALIRAHRGERSRDHEALVARRAALVALLQARMRRVVKAADVVFRHMPDIAKAARSPRERARIAAMSRTRRAKRDTVTEPAAEPTPAPIDPTNTPA